MHNIRLNRFSPVRFWHLGIWLLTIIGLLSPQPALAYIPAELSHTSTASLMILPNYRPATILVADQYYWNEQSQSLFPALFAKAVITTTQDGHLAMKPVASKRENFVLGQTKELLPAPVLTPSPATSREPNVSPTPTAKPTPKPTAKPKPKPTAVPEVKSATAAPAPVVAAPADMEGLFQQHAATHGVSADIMKKIAQCESGMRPEAVNGPYGGMFQFIASTWASNRRAMGKDTDPSLRFNASEAIETAAFKMGRDGYGAWPACSRKALASI